jgi:hypothetical protein
MLNFKSFRFWCQKVLPAIYDDSLSYYELLCKVVTYLNDMSSQTETQFNNLETLFNELKGFVNNYFDNLSVQDEINKKLDDMAKSGELEQLFFAYSNYLTPEMFGAKGDGVTNDNAAFNKCLVAASTKNLSVICRKTTYLIDTLNITSNIYINFNNCTLISTGGNIINISAGNAENGVIENCIINANNNIGININYMQHFTINNVFIYNVNNIGIHCVSGYENTLSNIKIYGLQSNSAIGIKTETGYHDNNFNNIIMKDLNYGFYLQYGLNHITQYHIWSSNAVMYAKSVGIKLGGTTICSDIHFDTVSICIEDISEEWRGKIGLTNVVCDFPYNYESLLTDTPYFYHCLGGDGSNILYVNGIDVKSTGTLIPKFTNLLLNNYYGGKISTHYLGTQMNNVPYSDIILNIVSSLTLNGCTLDGSIITLGGRYSGTIQFNITLTANTTLSSYTTLISGLPKHKNKLDITNDLLLENNTTNKLYYDINNGLLKNTQPLSSGDTIKGFGIYIY